MEYLAYMPSDELPLPLIGNSELQLQLLLADHIRRLRMAELAIKELTAFREKADKWFDKQDTLEDERDRVESLRHQENKDRLDKLNAKTAKQSLLTNVMQLAIALAALCVSLLAIYVGFKMANHSLVLPVWFQEKVPSLATTVLNSGSPVSIHF